MQMIQSEKDQSELVHQIERLSSPEPRSSTPVISDGFRDKFFDLETQLQSLQAQHKQEVRTLKEQHIVETDRLSRQIASFQEELGSAAEKIHDLQVELNKQSEYTTSLDTDLLQENRKLAGDLSRLSEENRRLNSELNSLRHKFDKTVNKLKREFETQNSQDMETASRKIKELQLEIDAQMQFTDRQAEELVEQTKLETAKVFAQELSAERKNYQQKIKNLETDVLAQVENYKRYRIQSEAKISQLQESCTKLQAQTLTNHEQVSTVSLPPVPFSRPNTPAPPTSSTSPPFSRPYSGRKRPSSASATEPELLPVTSSRITELLTTLSENVRSYQKSGPTLSDKEVSSLDINMDTVSKVLEELSSLLLGSLPARNLVRQLQGLRYIVSCSRLPSQPIVSFVIQILDLFKKDSGFIPEFSSLGALSNTISMLENSKTNSKTALVSFIRYLTSSESLVDSLIEMGAIPALLATLADSSIDTRRLVMKAMRNLCFKEAAKTVVRRSDGLPIIASQLSRKDSELIRYTARTLMLLSMNSENRIEFRLKNIIPVVLKSLDSSDVDVLKSLTGALINVALNTKNKPELISLGILPKLTRILSFDDKDLQLYSLRILCNLSTEDQFKLMIRDSGLLRIIVNIATKTLDPGCKKYALRLLSILASYSETVAAVQNFSMVGSVCSSVSSKDVEVVTEAVKVLAGLSTGNNHIAAQILKSGIISEILNVFTSALQSDNKSLLSSCLSLTKNLGQHSEAKEVLARERRLILMLLECCSSKTTEISVFAFETISHLSTNDKFKSDFKAANGFITLSNFFTTQDADTIIYLVKSVANFASIEANRVIFKDLGVLPPLLSWLNSSNIEVIRSAIKALYVLTLEEVCESEVMNLGGLRTILECVGSSDLEVKRKSLGTCCNLSISDSHKASFKSLSALGLIVSHLGHDDSKVARDSARCLRNLSFDDNNKKEIFNIGGVSELLKCLVSKDVQVVRYAMRTLSILSVASEIRQSMDSSALRSIVTLLASEDVETRRSSAGALINLSISTKNKAVLRDCGALSLLVKCLTSPDLDTIRYALRALTNLTFDEKNELALMSSNAHAVILKFVGSADKVSHRYSLSCLCNMSCTPQSRRALLELDVVSKIVKTVLHESDSKAERDALRILSHMCLDDGGRGNIRNKDGFNALVKGLQSLDVNSKLFALNSVKCLALDSMIALNELKSHGFFALIKECQNSDDSSLSSTATEILRIFEN
ncbi:hypothetical protein GEMRC1_003545 [Eukaryota sp. GEM-RC1]